ncbi:MAG: hypothetical protein NZ602_03035 [Thermoguttaceae bacterium]|nr:hypothetical protein [Thermoguttaceae bacterium]MDW8036861.1 hypothetical protein [Thermoguttaceae bacterium]
MGFCMLMVLVGLGVGISWMVVRRRAPAGLSASAELDSAVSPDSLNPASLDASAPCQPADCSLLHPYTPPALLMGGYAPFNHFSGLPDASGAFSPMPAHYPSFYSWPPCALHSCSQTPQLLSEYSSPLLADLQKTLLAFRSILQAFGRQSPALSAALFPDFFHDLALMLQQADLSSIALELLDADQNVLFRYLVQFSAPEKPSTRDPARGVEIPVLPCSSIASHRIVLGPLFRFHEYAARLRHRWRSAQAHPLDIPNHFLSKHLEVFSGARLSAHVFVSDLARRTGTIIEVAPDKRFAFASCAHVPQPVFLHQSECDWPLRFQVGKTSLLSLSILPRLSGAEHPASRCIACFLSTIKVLRFSCGYTIYRLLPHI